MKDSPALLVVLALPLLCCAPAPAEDPAARRCTLTVGYRVDRLVNGVDAPPLTQEQAERAELIGSWDGFRRPGQRTFARAQVDAGLPAGDWRVTSLTLPPAEYLYAIVVGGRVILDERNPQSAFIRSPLLTNDRAYGTEVSRALIPDCRQPLIEALAVDTSEPGALAVTARFLPGLRGAALNPADPAALQLRLRRGPPTSLSGAGADLDPAAVQITPQPATAADAAIGATARLRLRAVGLPAGKYTLTVQARDGNGVLADPISASGFVSAQTPPPARALADGLVYQIMIDRFRGSDGGPLPPPRTPTARAGGTLAGVQALVERGYFERLGVSTLWLSPVYQNPRGQLPGRLGLAEAYHGYWPQSPREVEPQLGGPGALDALVSAAHGRGLRVILDAVPNHLHQDHPYYLQRSRKDPRVASAPDADAASWFNDGTAACICGNPGCGWGERLEDCWFEPFLPDLNWRNPEVAAQGAADLAYWMERFDLDGLRLDAVPMMPRAATRRVVRALQEQTFRAGLDRLLLGETYTGPGDYGRQEIRAYLGKIYDGLDSQFDFPLMWALRQTLAKDDPGGFPALEVEVGKSRSAFGGSGGVIAHIIGNHDTTRFLSEANGDLGGPNAPQQPSAAEPYQRQLLALALVLTLPGLPVLYYGDEVGLAGGGDPDCRRVLPDVMNEGQLLPPQRELLQKVRRLGRLRACMSALRGDVRRVLYSDDSHQATLRGPMMGAEVGRLALVVLSRSRSAASLPVPDLPAGVYVDALSGQRVTASGGVTALAAAPLAAAVYLPAGDPCLADSP